MHTLAECLSFISLALTVYISLYLFCMCYLYPVSLYLYNEIKEIQILKTYAVI